jgi:hypothetical protein
MPFTPTAAVQRQSSHYRRQIQLTLVFNNGFCGCGVPSDAGHTIEATGQLPGEGASTCNLQSFPSSDPIVLTDTPTSA